MLAKMFHPTPPALLATHTTLNGYTQAMGTSAAPVLGAEAGRSVAGKLIVQCVGLKGTPPWVFYLHGVSPKPS